MKAQPASAVSLRLRSKKGRLCNALIAVLHLITSRLRFIDDCGYHRLPRMQLRLMITSVCPAWKAVYLYSELSAMSTRVSAFLQTSLTHATSTLSLTVPDALD